MIFESIVVTLSDRGETHIAPMGIRHVDGLVLIAPFRPSVTLDNLSETHAAVVNFTDDVRVFAGCLTGRSEWPTREAEQVKGRVLSGALAHSEVTVEKVEDDALRPRFYCREVHRETHAAFRGFNRAQAAVIEAAILVSRLDRLPADKIDAEIAYLSIAVDKTAGPREQEAWAWLMARIGDARQSGCSGR